jgi:hypothetical protein
MLVETSDDKSPRVASLGSPREILEPNGAGSGHVSRNVRVSLLALDLVEPYVTIRSFNGENLTRDLVPMTPRSSRTCKGTRAFDAIKRSSPTVTWTAGGAMSVDETKVWFARWIDVPERVLNCLSQPSSDDVTRYMMEGVLTSGASGSGRFAPGGETVFSARLDLTGFDVGDELVMLAAVKVDARWGAVPVDAVPLTNWTPQTHIVQARTNSSWMSTDNGKVVQGHEFWFSPPVTVTVV